MMRLRIGSGGVGFCVCSCPAAEPSEALASSSCALCATILLAIVSEYTGVIPLCPVGVDPVGESRFVDPEAGIKVVGTVAAVSICAVRVQMHKLGLNKIDYHRVTNSNENHELQSARCKLMMISQKWSADT
jgi:hypothetical protein